MRFMSRVLIVAAVVVALTTLSVPTAHALPLAVGTEALRLDGSWFQAALSWIAHLLPTGDQGALQRATSTSATTDSKMKPNTGSCIDPQGTGLCGGM